MKTSDASRYTTTDIADNWFPLVNYEWPRKRLGRNIPFHPRIKTHAQTLANNRTVATCRLRGCAAWFGAPETAPTGGFSLPGFVLTLGESTYLEVLIGAITPLT